MCVAKWALLKGAKRVIGVDRVPERLAFAREKLGIETLDFSQHSDVVKRLQEVAPGGLNVAIDCGAYERYSCLTVSLILTLHKGTFHQPKTTLHKIEKALMLETDVSEIVNEMIMAVKKGGRCGIIAAYAGYTNHFNIGALMEKGVRLIGNGQAPVHKWWKEILYDYIIPGKFDPTL